MTDPRERFTNGYMDDEGDVMPLEDLETHGIESHLVPHSNFRSAHGNLRNYDAEADVFDSEMRQANVIAKGQENPGVSVSMEQYYQDQLDLLDIISGASMRGGFAKTAPHNANIQARYQENLPRVEVGAHRNHARALNRDILIPYHTAELIGAGVGYKEEILFDARTMMRNEIKYEYAGPENAAKRQVRRKKLRMKLAELATKSKE